MTEQFEVILRDDEGKYVNDWVLAAIGIETEVATLPIGWTLEVKRVK